MDFVKLGQEDFEALAALHRNYKREIGENLPTEGELERLREAMNRGQIHFYGCEWGGQLVACCSICLTYSTFHYGPAGVFEDFYILPKYRHQGIARKLVRFAYEQSGAGSLTVGCADCDLKMYQSLGFELPLGHLLAFQG